MTSVVKVRIYPNNIQKNLLSQHFGSVRYIFNMMLSKKKDSYESTKESISIYELKKLLPKLKDTIETAWLKCIDSTVLQNTILNLGKAYDNFFRRIKKKEEPGFPRFKSKNDSKQSYQTSGAKIKEDGLYLPKIGTIKTKFHREITGEVKTTTISREGKKYYASINLNSNKENIVKNNGNIIGLDVGIKVFAYLSNGQIIQKPNFKKEEKEIVKRHKILSRRKKGSSNRLKAKFRLKRAYQKLQNKRDDFLHKVSNELSENQTVVVEKLKIKNMTKSKQGTKNNPNMQRAQKKGLNKSILSQAWSRFFDFLEYKLKRNGNKLVKVKPHYTSITCSHCNYISKESRVSQSQFICKNCDKEINADYNASINILKAYLCGGNHRESLLNILTEVESSQEAPSFMAG